MAQIPTAGYAYFGYSLNHGTTDPLADTATLHGWEASVEGRIFPHIGIVGDVAEQFGTQFLPPLGFHVDTHSEQFLFGPRVSFRVGPVRPFVHVLLGVGHVHEVNHNVGVADSDTAFANTIGGGLDYTVAGPLNWRAQLESLNTNFFGDWQHNTRFSTGLSFRF
jgi:hypothetical protein